MIFNVQILPTANKELTDIVSYSLSRMPDLAELGYHSAFVDDYIFLYYEEDDCIVVAHFFHQRQNYASLVCSREIESSN